MRFLILALLAGCSSGYNLNHRYSQTCTAEVFDPMFGPAKVELPCLFSYGGEHPSDGSYLVIDEPGYYVFAEWQTRLEAIRKDRPCRGWKGTWSLKQNYERTNFTWSIYAWCKEDGGNIVPSDLDLFAYGQL